MFQGARFRSVELTGRGLHTFLGILGYTLKDHAQPHFMNIMSDDITDEMIEAGRKQYQMFGAGDNKKRDSISPTNLMAKCEVGFLSSFRRAFLKCCCCASDVVATQDGMRRTEPAFADR